jgi:hypothetical protein
MAEETISPGPLNRDMAMLAAMAGRQKAVRERFAGLQLSRRACSAAALRPPVPETAPETPTGATGR